jgi:hypothetical protein
MFLSMISLEREKKMDALLYNLLASLQILMVQASCIVLQGLARMITNYALIKS